MIRTCPMESLVVCKHSLGSLVVAASYQYKDLLDIHICFNKTCRYCLVDCNQNTSKAFGSTGGRGKITAEYIVCIETKFCCKKITA